MVLVSNRESFEAARTVLIDADIIALDTETWWGSFKEPTMMGIATHCKIKGREDYEISYYFPFNHKHSQTLFEGQAENLPTEWLRELKVPFERKDVKFIFHNAKFDILVMERCGIKITADFYDVMLMSWMLDENPPHALKRLGEIHLGADSSREEKIIQDIANMMGGWDCIPPEAMGPYAEKDVQLTYRLWEHFMPLLKQQEMDHLWEDEMVLSRCLYAMERRGIAFDVERAKQLSYEADCRMQAIQKTLGFDPAKRNQLAHRLFDPPPDGLGLTPTALGKPSKSFPKGVPVMDKAALSRYDDPTIDLVLEYRGRQKAKSSYFDAWITHMGSDQRIHPEYKQHGTLTTRLSCAEPNMQQIPRTKEEERDQGVSKALVKTLLRATEGHELWEFDYSQLEFRLAASYANEESILEGYRQGVDFHSLTATKLGVDRHVAKTLNFAVLYGAGPEKLAETLFKEAKVHVTEAQARQVLSDFREAYPRLMGFRDDAQKLAQARHGWIRYWDGRRRHFKFPSEYHKAMNSAIQGGGARIVAKTMRDFYLNYPDYRLVAQVHDALWFEIPVDQVEEQKAIIKQVMEWPKPPEFRLEFPVDEKRLWPNESLPLTQERKPDSQKLLTVN